MRERGVPRDTITYNTVLHALDKGGRSKIAFTLFKEMRRERVPPNTLTFAAAISACAHAGAVIAFVHRAIGGHKRLGEDFACPPYRFANGVWTEMPTRSPAAISLAVPGFLG